MRRAAAWSSGALLDVAAGSVVLNTNANLGTPRQAYARGNFNYDGQIDATDMLIINTNFASNRHRARERRASFRRRHARRLEPPTVLLTRFVIVSGHHQMKVFLILLALAATAFGQATSEEIQRKLAELHTRAATNPATDPTTAPAASTQPARSAVDLQLDAIAAMRANQYPKAAPLIEQAFRQTPPQQLTRPLILNRAIVDFMQTPTIQRAVKDLNVYVALHPWDEFAVDLLGAADAKAVERSPRFAASPLCNEAEHTLAAAIDTLQSARPNMRKWGPLWMSAQDFRDIQQKQKHAEWEIDQASRALASADKDLAAAKATAAALNTIDSDAGKRGTGRARYQPDTIAAKQEQAKKDRAEAQATLARAESTYRDALAKLEAARRDMPHPDWPAAFEPIDPRAPDPAPPEAARHNSNRVRRDRADTSTRPAQQDLPPPPGAPRVNRAPGL